MKLREWRKIHFRIEVFFGGGGDDVVAIDIRVGFGQRCL